MKNSKFQTYYSGFILSFVCPDFKNQKWSLFSVEIPPKSNEICQVSFEDFASAAADGNVESTFSKLTDNFGYFRSKSFKKRQKTCNSRLEMDQKVTIFCLRSTPPPTFYVDGCHGKIILLSSALYFTMKRDETFCLSGAH